MQIYNSVGNVVKSGGRTRRAAILLRLDCDHPDILDFITSKSNEELRVKKMVEEAGFSPNFWEEDSAYSRAWYQNTNISVGVTDAFMRAVENKEDWNLISRTTGETIHTVKAHELFYEMAKAAWICGDPGVQFEDTINSWNTCPNSGRITTSNPCSEVFFLDHSSCNLAVLNLIKFWENDTFNIQDFKAAVERAITAQEILCELGTYPTPEITQTTVVLPVDFPGYLIPVLRIEPSHPYPKL